jgi:hypothetical protein
MALAISVLFFDLSWDGQWYHQVGIYHLERGWNPLTEPLREFVQHNERWVLHYAKGPWYTAAAAFKTFGYMESGKFLNWLAIDAMFMAVLATGLDWGMRRTRALAIAILVSLNPVVWLESMTYLVDGLMVSYLVVYCAVLLSCLRKPSRVVVYVGVTAAICMINTKFTGLVFLCFFCAAGGFYCLVKRRDLVWRYAALNLLAIGLGTFVWGYNPYVTNIVHRGHPFYPQMGTKEYPGLVGQENDGIEKWETPHNMKGRSRWLRMAYSVFGRPGNAPYQDQLNAELMWPFAARLSDMAVYRFHEARISGFGPYFSGALLLSVGLLVWILMSRNTPRLLLLLGCTVILVTLFISKHLWWARYGPQMWLLPFVPIIAAFGLDRSKWQVILAWILCGILVINPLIPAAVHLRWEIKATKTLRRQLIELRDAGQKIEVSLQWFGEPVEERFKTWGIPYRKLGRRELQSGPMLMSVVEGYPGAIHYRVAEDSPETIENDI